MRGENGRMITKPGDGRADLDHPSLRLAWVDEVLAAGCVREC
jgi:hypothetical protein